MLSEQLSPVLAGGAVDLNIFTNSRYATLSVPANLTYYGVQDGATLASDALIEITHGNVIVRSNSAIPQVAAGIGPLLNEHMIGSGGADVNDRIVIRAQNSGIAASNFRIIVMIQLMPELMQ